MKMTTHIIDGKSYKFRTKDNKTELVIKAKTTPKQDKIAHKGFIVTYPMEWR